MTSVLAKIHRRGFVSSLFVGAAAAGLVSVAQAQTPTQFLAASVSHRTRKGCAYERKPITAACSHQ
jgi:hypothetical protein